MRFTQLGRNYALFIEFDEGKEFHSEVVNTGYAKKFVTYNKLLLKNYVTIDGTNYIPIVARITYPLKMRTNDRKDMLKNDFTGYMDQVTYGLLSNTINHAARYANEYVLCRFESKIAYEYKAKHVCKEDIARDTKMHTLEMFETYGKDINLDRYIYGGIAKVDDFYYNRNVYTTTSMSKSNIDAKENDRHLAKEEERNTTSGFITLDEFKGCRNWEEIDMQNPKYDEHTRFIKTVYDFGHTLSDWYHNGGKINHGIYQILPKLAPHATKLYNERYAYNINEYVKSGKDTIAHMLSNKRQYLENVFSNSESNEYDKMFAATVIVSEIVMWSEDDVYHKQCTKAIKGYYTDFFRTNRQYITDSRLLKRWDELVSE